MKNFSILSVAIGLLASLLTCISTAQTCYVQYPGVPTYQSVPAHCCNNSYATSNIAPVFQNTGVQNSIVGCTQPVYRATFQTCCQPLHLNGFAHPVIESIPGTLSTNHDLPAIQQTFTSGIPDEEPPKNEEICRSECEDIHKPGTAAFDECVDDCLKPVPPPVPVPQPTPPGPGRTPELR